jgi:hypothetical protein
VAKIKIAGEEPSLIPEDNYQVIGQGYSLGDYRGAGKLYFSMCICEGGFSGLRLEMYYNVKLVRVVGGQDTFECRPRSKYLRQMRLLFSDIEDAGGDFLSPDNLDGIKLLVEVKTVVHDSGRQPLSAKDRYSKVSRIIKVIEE